MRLEAAQAIGSARGPEVLLSRIRKAIRGEGFRTMREWLDQSGSEEPAPRL